jgi:hypothetical protein
MAGSRRLRCIEIGEVDVLKVEGDIPGEKIRRKSIRAAYVHVQGCTAATGTHVEYCGHEQKYRYAFTGHSQARRATLYCKYNYS